MNTKRVSIGFGCMALAAIVAGGAVYWLTHNVSAATTFGVLAAGVTHLPLAHRGYFR